MSCNLSCMDKLTCGHGSQAATVGETDAGHSHVGDVALKRERDPGPEDDAAVALKKEKYDDVHVEATGRLGMGQGGDSGADGAATAALQESAVAGTGVEVKVGATAVTTESARVATESSAIERPLSVAGVPVRYGSYSACSLLSLCFM
jgi:hypothetical protein